LGGIQRRLVGQPQRGRHRDHPASVGAFDRVADNKDTAILTWLEPGTCTAKVSGDGETTAVALAEVWTVKPFSFPGSGKVRLEMAGT